MSKGLRYFLSHFSGLLLDLHSTLLQVSFLQRGCPKGELSPITFLSKLGAITIITIRDSLTHGTAAARHTLTGFSSSRVFVNLGGTCFYKAVTLASHQSDDLAAALAREIISYRIGDTAVSCSIFVAQQVRDRHSKAQLG